MVLSLLKLKPNYSFSTAYHDSYPDAIDLRNMIGPKEEKTTDAGFRIIPYSQVFETRHGFLPNLSIVDLLFNQGPRATDYF